MRRTFHFGEFTCTASVVTRANVFADLGPAIFSIADRNTAQYLPDRGAHHRLPAGEASKSWGELERILANMLASDLTRSSTAVGVGGGVVCDITAMAASLYMRGCGLVLVPTTLLAMVDAALGGKTGVNFAGFKNMVGTFYPAGEVRVCPELLATLPEREYLSGLAEAIKTAMLGDAALLTLLEAEHERVIARDEALLSQIVWGCVEIKGGIVETDLKEHGIRAHLNLGHTFAHALESVQGLGTWSHGEAVAWGLARAMELGVRAGITESAYADRVFSLLDRYRYRTRPVPEAAHAIQDAMKKDKKRRDDEIRFVLQRGPGDTLITEVDSRLVGAVLKGS